VEKITLCIEKLTFCIEKITAGVDKITPCSSAILDFVEYVVILAYKFYFGEMIDFFKEQVLVAGDGF
jgi:hypothetical protein